ncbi:Protein vein [Dufourea novaeangliae]|uniref:Protein vein n=1 Tax=Dufourea novaeangliae TaxID=178035 RepID=A0A154P872_DUFNO|nr:Protein vein [Dufourea novaeangliae]
MWASLLLAGILSGWWGALALAAAPPANRNSLEETSTRTTSDHPPSMSIAAVEKPLNYRLPTWNFVTRTIDERGREEEVAGTDRDLARSPRDYELPADDDDDDDDVPGRTSRLNERERRVKEEEEEKKEDDDERTTTTTSSSVLVRTPVNDKPVVESSSWTRPRDAEVVSSTILEESTAISSVVHRDSRFSDDQNASAKRREELLDKSIRDAFVSSSMRANRRLEDDAIGHPRTDESGLIQPPRHSSTQTPFLYAPSGENNESSMERPRVIRSTKQRPKNRTKADSPREQRRRCRNKGCRGQNWCPDVDVGNRAYLAPTVFEGKARSMSSARQPGSNYAVTFEVKQVYKSQPGFQPLQKNDSVRLHFRDKSAPGKSTVCGYDTDGKQQEQQQRDNQSGVVRANIKRGKVYLVFVNRVGPRNFTILGEPVIRSKKNEQAVQAVVRPDYGEYCYPSNSSVRSYRKNRGSNDDGEVNQDKEKERATQGEIEGQHRGKAARRVKKRGKRGEEKKESSDQRSGRHRVVTTRRELLPPSALPRPPPPPSAPRAPGEPACPLFLRLNSSNSRAKKRGPSAQWLGHERGSSGGRQGRSDENSLERVG